MAEKILAKLRVKKIEAANPITAADGISSATWEEWPLTLRDDELLISEEEPEEEELYSHENDAPEDIDVTGAGLRVTGTFIKATREQMADLMGGEAVTTGEGESAVTKYHHSASKLVLKKALRFTCHDGSEVVVPNASGYVNIGLNIGKGGRAAFPFNFRCLKASSTWDCDLVL